MEWFWVILVIIFVLIILILLLCYKMCKKSVPAYRRYEITNITSPMAAPGFIADNQRVPLGRDPHLGAMPMPPSDFRGFTSLSVNHGSRERPYRQTAPTLNRPYPPPRIERQFSNSTNDLPPSYEVATAQQSILSVNNIHRPYSEGNVRR